MTRNLPDTNGHERSGSRAEGPTYTSRSIDSIVRCEWGRTAIPWPSPDPNSPFWNDVCDSGGTGSCRDRVQAFVRYRTSAGSTHGFRRECLSRRSSIAPDFARGDAAGASDLRGWPVTFSTKSEARGWLSLQHAEITRKAWAPPQVMPSTVVTFGMYAEQWLTQRDLKPRTREHYRKLLDGHLLPAFGPDALTSITPESVRSWHAGMGTRTPTLRAHCYSLLRTILGTAVTDGLLSANPCHIRGAGGVQRAITIRPLTLPELAKITAAMPARYQAMVTLAAWCALRFGELAELRRRDVDIDIQTSRGVIHVERGVVRAAGGVVVGAPKSTAGRRDVAIPPYFLEAIQEHLACHVGPGPDDLLFPAVGGGHLAPGTLGRYFGAARAGVSNPTTSALSRGSDRVA